MDPANSFLLQIVWFRFRTILIISCNDYSFLIQTDATVFRTGIGHCQAREILVSPKASWLLDVESPVHPSLGHHVAREFCTLVLILHHHHHYYHHQLILEYLRDFRIAIWLWCKCRTNLRTYFRYNLWLARETRHDCPNLVYCFLFSLWFAMEMAKIEELAMFHCWWQSLSHSRFYLCLILYHHLVSS